MSVIYIAGPMTGLPDFNYPAFNAAEVALRAAGHSPLNPTRAELLNPTPGVPQAWGWYMRHALRMVIAAEAIALLPGWEYSTGARLEFHVGEGLGLRCRPLSQWLLGRCSACDLSIEVDDLQAGHGMCGSCLHNAVRSGWTVGS